MSGLAAVCAAQNQRWVDTRAAEGRNPHASAERDSAGVVTAGSGPVVIPTRGAPRMIVRILRVVFPILMTVAYLTMMFIVTLPPVSIALTTLLYVSMIGACIVYSRTLSKGAPISQTAS